MRLKARRKELGNTQEITVVYPPLHYALNYERSGRSFYSMLGDSSDSHSVTKRWPVNHQPEAEHEHRGLQSPQDSPSSVFMWDFFMWF